MIWPIAMGPTVRESREDKFRAVTRSTCPGWPRFVQRSIIDQDVAISDLYRLSWERDNALDQRDLLVGYVHDHDVSSARTVKEVIGDLIDQDTLVVV